VGNCVAGKVIVITGAGRGIGREIALLAGAEGAKVVVNDLGGSADGDGSDVSVAQAVANEIGKAGGVAVANGDSVADPQGAERIIKTAIDHFGRVDCVVNNAGILRDRIFHRMSAVDWDAVIKVHLYGAFYMSKAAAPYFKEQEQGSYIHFTSTSGLVGNFGQANYAAAKLGIVGLSKSIALDMARFKVRSNCVSPFAWSRLIGTIPVDTPEQKARVERIQNTMTASKIAPICVFLASDLARDVSGQIFAVRKDEIFLMSQSRPLRVAHKDGGWTPQAIAETVLPAFASAFYALDRSQDVFNWEPL
jgi:NAD(P)-dependent dehydrogenase (short-subunit alcohol dehydrogenase family)